MKAGQHGFTMVELVTVMILLGILSAAIVPRMLSRGDTAGPVFRSDILTALRYAQKTAVSHRRLVCAAIGAGTVTLRISPNNPSTAGCTVALPGPDGAIYNSSDPGTTAATTIQGNTLQFLPNGDILDGAGVLIGTATITVTGQATINVDGGGVHG
ncbi:Tfp pilus assembly protein FimT/FimU [Massilia sp. YIM B04103]|uniref:pilus assembly FimT family protein n=1 Tax=Massilia sp. YIM B04103 TaxID=2963106 RepID=UPI00210C3465|nr:prepilin-type N-terminal cleavage/methylation domain-containing protein [Massilia sp. YIM B04103]